MPTALQIAQGREVPLTMGIFQAVMSEAPTLAVLDARTSRSTKFLSLRLVSLPNVSTFARYSEGFTPAEAAFALAEFNCSLIGGQIKAEQITARKWNAEHGGAGVEWFDIQAQANFKKHGENLNAQIYSGTSSDADGFPGFKELTPFVSGNVVTATQRPADFRFARSVINAGGTTDNTASSVYAWIDGEMDVQLVLGEDMNGGELFRLSEMIVSNEAPNSAEPTKKSLHDLQQFDGHIGLSVSGMNQTGTVPTQYSLRRITNLTADSGKGLTDALMMKLSQSFGNNKRPSRYSMSTRSGEQLALARQAVATFNVNMGPGAAAQQSFNSYPPPPDNFNGVPIIYDDYAIGITDALEA